MRPKGVIWDYFSEVDDNTVKCKICDRDYSRKGRGTSALRSHLKCHEVEYAVYEKKNEDTKQGAAEKKRKGVEETPLQQAKRQVTLQETLQRNQHWELSHEKSRQLDKLICEMLALQDLPFNFVEGIGFRRLMLFGVPRYHLRGRQCYSTLMCNYVYPKLKEKIQDLINNLEHLTFTTDIWSEPGAGVSLLSFTVHGIDTNFKRVSLVLKCVTLEERHTGDLIAQKLEEIREEWGIPRQKLHVMVRDGGSNMKRAARVSQINDIDCTIHKLQLCIRAALTVDDYISTLLSKCKQIATHFSHSLIAQKELQSFQQRLGLSELSVIQECPTRWNSMFQMIERLIVIKDAIVLYTSQHTNLPQLDPNDWLQLERCAKILKPFDEVTKSMSNSEACISSVIPLIHVLTCSMQNFLKADHIHFMTDQNSQNMIIKLIEEISNRFGELHNNMIYSIATYLDPKYKTKFFNEITKERVESEILTLCQHGGRGHSENEAEQEHLIQTHNENEPSTSSGVSGASKGRVVQSLLVEMLASSEPNSENEEEENSPLDRFVVLKSLMVKYTKEKRVPIEEDSLVWWKKKPQFIDMYQIVRQYLSAPPSSVPSERLFSSAGLVYDELRNRLSGETAAKLIFIKCNLPIVNFDY